jgi:AcrR family transcriptional regulator
MNLSDTKSRGRQRSVTSEAAILTATMQLLGQMPLREITIEAIAAKARVGKATIYKWWPNKAHLALDAYLKHMKSSVPVPNTGSARQDFSIQMQAVVRFYTSSVGHIFRQFLAEGQSDPEFAALFLERFLRPRRDEVKIIWQRGVERGEINGSLELELVLDLIYGPMIFRLMAGHAPLNAETAKTIVESVFDGIESCAPASSTTSSRAATKRNTALGSNGRPVTGKQQSAAKEQRQPGHLE